MLMALKFLMTVQKNPTIETSEQIIQFLNSSVSNPDSVTEYIIIGMIIRIHSDESYNSELEARSRAGGYFSLGTKHNAPITATTP